MELKRVEMVDYDPVKEMAQITFVGSKSTPVTIWIHRATFEALNSKWDDKAMGGRPFPQQKELKDAIERSKEISKDPMGWFKGESNEIIRKAAQRAKGFSE